MEMQQLRHFIALAEHGNMAATADRLGISQSGLTRSLQALEASVGLSLFERHGRGVSLNQFGRELLPRAKAILGERDRALQELTAFRRLDRGQLALGVMPTFVHALAPQLITEMINESAGLELHVIAGTFAELTDLLISGEIQLALVLGVSPEHPDIAFRPLYPVHTAVFCGIHHPLADTHDVALSTLLEYPWALTRSPSLRLEFERFFNQHLGTVPTLRLLCSSIGLLTQALRDTPLLTVLPGEFARSALLRRRLRRLDVTAPASDARAWLATRRSRPTSPATDLAERLIEKAIGTAVGEAAPQD